MQKNSPNPSEPDRRLQALGRAWTLRPEIAKAPYRAKAKRSGARAK